MTTTTSTKDSGGRLFLTEEEWLACFKSTDEGSKARSSSKTR
jgi:cupin superfamily acireductone dioxygenase involved in methionine salvage